jgi:hypothetical protein
MTTELVVELELADAREKRQDRAEQSVGAIATACREVAELPEAQLADAALTRHKLAVRDPAVLKRLPPSMEEWAKEMDDVSMDDILAETQEETEADDLEDEEVPEELDRSSSDERTPHLHHTAGARSA